MTSEDAKALIAEVLSAYKAHHKNFLARVIVLKTSRFRDEEAQGIMEALDEVGTEMKDLVLVQESSSMKVMRDGNYPVMRGTFVEMDGKGLLYTNGAFHTTAPIRACMTHVLFCCVPTGPATARLPRSQRRCSR